MNITPRPSTLKHELWQDGAKVSTVLIVQHTQNDMNMRSPVTNELSYIAQPVETSAMFFICSAGDGSDSHQCLFKHSLVGS